MTQTCHNRHQHLAAFTNELTALAKILEDVEFAIIYGSLPTGQMRPGSDVDLAVMCPSPLTPERHIQLIGEVGAIFSRKADVLDLRRAGPIVKMQVLKNGLPVIVNDVDSFEQFRMYTPCEYFDFKISRRPIEEAIKVQATPCP